MSNNPPSSFPPVPPHAHPTDPSDLSYEQNAALLDRGYVRYVKYKHCYEQCRLIMEGKRPPGIIQWPTGQMTESGTPDFVDVDLNSVAGVGRPDEERLPILIQVLTPVANHVAQEYIKWLKGIATASTSMVRLIDQSQQVSSPPPPPVVTA